MSREIKFRAWAVGSKVMFYPNEDDGIGLQDGSLLPLPNTVLMQFTGLLDKNGKEIYEGDVVRCRELKGTVIWHETGWFLDNGKWKDSLFGVINFTTDAEIIGDIYENQMHDIPGFEGTREALGKLSIKGKEAA